MRWLWHTLAALDGEYGPHIQAHIVGRLADVALVRSPPGSTTDA